MSILIDGLPAAPDDLAHQALVNYGAYTSFRVEHGAVRGLELHLARLEQAAVELFGESPGEAEFRRLMALGVAGRDACWLRVSLFSPDIAHRDPSYVGRPKVMTSVSSAPPPLAQRVRITAMPYEREAPHLKHLATFGLIRARRAARAAGFERVELMATLAGEPLYAACGYVPIERVASMAATAVSVPGVRMGKAL